MSYSGAFLSESSRNDLLRWCEKVIGPATGRVIAEHMTSEFRPSKASLSTLEKGKVVALQVVGYASDDRCQAVVVRCNALPSKNANPHITICVSGGAKPFYSNTLLGRGWTPADGPWLAAAINVGPLSSPTHIPAASAQAAIDAARNSGGKTSPQYRTFILLVCLIALLISIVRFATAA